MSRKLIQTNATPQSMVPSTLTIKGGTFECKGGMLIDGKLTDCTIESVDDSLIHVSAIAVLNDCIFKAKDLLIEGRTNLCVYRVAGDLEITGSAEVSGKAYVAGDTLISRLVDKRDLIMANGEEKASAQLTQVETNLAATGT